MHFKRLGSRVSRDSFNQYVSFFSKQCTYCKTSNSYIANKRGFVQIIPPSWGLSYQFDWHAINRSRR